MGKPDLKYKPKKAKDVVFQFMPPETVILNLVTGYYYSTNKLGTEVWRLCDGDTDIASLIEKLHRQFDVSRDQLAEDVLAFISQMITEGLLEVNELDQ